MYKIAVIAHQLKNGKVAKFGDEVSEKELNGNASDLLEKGYIVKDKEAAKKAKKAADKKAASDAKAKAEAEAKEKAEQLEKDINALSRMTTAELEDKALELKFEFTDAHSTNPVKAKALEAEMRK